MTHHRRLVVSAALLWVALTLITSVCRDLENLP